MSHLVVEVYGSGNTRNPHTGVLTVSAPLPMPPVEHWSERDTLYTEQATKIMDFLQGTLAWVVYERLIDIMIEDRRKEQGNKE